MPFQKLTITLVALVVLASQSVMGAPYAPPPATVSSKSATDNLLGNAGKFIGGTGGVFLPDTTMERGVKGAATNMLSREEVTYPYPSPPAAVPSQSVADNLLGNAGNFIGGTGGIFLPDTTMEQGIKGAATNMLSREEVTYPYPPPPAAVPSKSAADNLLGNAGKFIGGTGGIFLPDTTMEEGIKGAENMMSREDVEF